MAIQNFVSGSLRGKIGAHIGSSWKNKKTQRAYPDKVKDANSTAQQTVRGNFRAVTDVAKAINDVWTKTYFGSLKGMSGYNNFVKNQKGQMNSSSFTPASIQFPQSYLGAPIAFTATPTIADNVVTCAVPAPTELSLGTPTEYVVCVYDSTNLIAMAKKVTASATSVTFTLPITLETGNPVYCFLQAGDGTRTNFSSCVSITA